MKNCPHLSGVFREEGGKGRKQFRLGAAARHRLIVGDNFPRILQLLVTTREPSLINLTPRECFDQRCGSGIRCLFDPGSGIRKRFSAGSRISDPKPIFFIAMTNFLSKTTKIFSVLAFKKNSLPVKIKLLAILWYLWLQKLWDNKFFPLLFWCCLWIRDWKSRIRDKHPGSATLVLIRKISFMNLQDKVYVGRHIFWEIYWSSYLRKVPKCHGSAHWLKGNKRFWRG